MKTPAVTAMPRPSTARSVASSSDTRCIRSADLFGDRRTVAIEHAGEFYLLRRTSKGKLILTK